MLNWKTTLSGAITAVSAFVLFSPETFQSLPLLVTLAKFTAAGGLASLGYHATDKPEPPSEPPAHPPSQ